MNIQGYFYFSIVFLSFSCKDKGFDVPMGTPDSNTNQSSNANECPTMWSNLGGVWLDPNLCVAWSDKSDPMTLDDSEDFCAGLTEGELSGWRLPTLEELSSMSTAYNPMEDVLGDLWTSTEDTNSGLYWTINLDQPGMEVLLDPNDEANVRCLTSLR
jgi:hypothetical protein